MLLIVYNDSYLFLVLSFFFFSYFDSHFRIQHIAEFLDTDISENKDSSIFFPIRNIT